MTLYNAILDAGDWCEAHGIRSWRSLIPGSLKTYEYYQRVLWRDVREFYTGEVERGFVEDDMIRLIDEQLTRAWNEGAREVGVEPADMTDEDLAVVEDIKNGELEHITGFLDAVEQARQDGTGYEQFRSRVDLWANRYNDVVNQAKVYFGGKTKLVWVYGDTEHCDTCAACNGIVAWAQEWEQSGLHPQSPPNGALECGGWKCQCTLEPTDRRRSANALERLMDIAVSGNV